MPTPDLPSLPEAEPARSLVGFALGSLLFFDGTKQMGWLLARHTVAKEDGRDFADSDRRCVADAAFDLAYKGALALVRTFPRLRPIVTGLVYHLVETCGLEDGSASAVVAQAAQFYLDAVHRFYGKTIEGPAVDAISEEISRAMVVRSAGWWLATHLEVELAAARRVLVERSIEVPEDLYVGYPLPRQDKIDRMVAPLLEPPGTIVLANPAAILKRPSEPPRPPVRPETDDRSNVLNKTNVLGVWRSLPEGAQRKWCRAVGFPAGAKQVDLIEGRSVSKRDRAEFMLLEERGILQRISARGGYRCTFEPPPKGER